MFKDRLSGDPDNGDFPTVEEIVDFARSIRTEKSKSKQYYTYSLIRGSIKVGSIRPMLLFVTSAFHQYGALLAADLAGKRNLDNISNFVRKIDVSNETSYKPRFDNQRELISFLEQTHMPEIILEYGRNKLGNEHSTPYVFLYHTIDMSIKEALTHIQALVSPWGKI